MMKPDQTLSINQHEGHQVEYKEVDRMLRVWLYEDNDMLATVMVGADSMPCHPALFEIVGKIVKLPNFADKGRPYQVIVQDIVEGPSLSCGKG